MKHSRISRVMKILTTLQAGRCYAAEDLSQMFGTSRRTIFRDLKELQAIGVPYRYDAKTGGYAIEPDFFLPPVDLNLQEALSLLMLAHKAGKQIQMPYRNSAILAALKIENNLPSQIRRYCDKALSSVSTKLSARASAGHELDKTFGQLQRAITGKLRVTVEYESFLEKGPIKLELCPYHLHYNKRAWYVLGYSDIHKSVRTLKLMRIMQLRVTDRGFVGGEDFDVGEHFGKAWSMIPEGRMYNVKLRFMPKVAGNVAEVQWHSTQKVTRKDDGSAIVEFRVDGIGEITWWILGYGDQVEILAPKALREKVVEVARRTIEVNSEA